MEEFFVKLKEGYEWEVGEAVEMIDANIEFADVPWLSGENKEISLEQHEGMMEKLVKKKNNLAEFMEDKEVVANEKEFVYKVDLPFSVTFDGECYDELFIIGSIDMIVKDKDGNLIVIDFKTSKKVFDNSKIKKNLQLPIYSLVVEDVYGRLPKDVVYYFTRFDEFQHGDPIVRKEDKSKRILFKSGKRKGQIRYKQKTCDEVLEELTRIFKLQYATGMDAYKSKSSALCSWCPHGFYEKHDCKYAQRFIRKDLDGYPAFLGK